LSRNLSLKQQELQEHEDFVIFHATEQELLREQLRTAESSLSNQIAENVSLRFTLSEKEQELKERSDDIQFSAIERESLQIKLEEAGKRIAELTDEMSRLQVSEQVYVQNPEDFFDAAASTTLSNSKTAKTQQRLSLLPQNRATIMNTVQSKFGRGISVSKGPSSVSLLFSGWMEKKGAGFFASWKRR
jgi:hypothetical protein